MTYMDPELSRMLRAEAIKMRQNMQHGAKQTKPADLNQYLQTMSKNAAVRQSDMIPDPQKTPFISAPMSAAPAVPVVSSVEVSWWKKGIWMSAARALACSSLIAIVLIIIRPEAVRYRPKRYERADKKSKSTTKGTVSRSRINFGSVCILSTLTGILATCMFGG